MVIEFLLLFCDIYFPIGGLKPRICILFYISLQTAESSSGGTMGDWTSDSNGTPEAQCGKYVDWILLSPEL